MLEVIIVILLVIIIALLAVLLLKKPAAKFDTSKLEERLIRVEGGLDKINPKIEAEFRENRKEINESLQGSRKEISENLQGVQKVIDTRIKTLQDDNSKKLDQMRETVDEKLQKSVEKRFNESFKQISGQLTQVYQGLGEMKTLASDVGKLNRTMTGVKTRGNYGEVQLESIISDMLSPSQYEKNIITKKGTKDPVEFAVKMPGQGDADVLLPIDSKFPTENYDRLIKAYDDADKSQIATFQKALATDIKTQAKKISDKYIDPPATTEFGVMFLPTESLYAEVLRIPGLADKVRQDYRISIASPTTLPTMLNGLLMGFRTVAIEKRSAEVWQTLGAVKSQFGKFGDLLAATKKKLEETANKIGSAEVTSRQIERKLKDVESLPENESKKLIGDLEV